MHRAVSMCSAARINTRLRGFDYLQQFRFVKISPAFAALKPDFLAFERAGNKNFLALDGRNAPTIVCHRLN